MSPCVLASVATPKFCISNFSLQLSSLKEKKMKIFDWVQRRFCLNSNSSSISLCEDYEFSKVSINKYSDHDDETKALLDQRNDSVFEDNWKLDEILTIGTLAVYPFGALACKESGLDNITDLDLFGKNVEHNGYFFDESDQWGAIAPPGGSNQTLELDSMLQDNTEKLTFYRPDLSYDLIKCNEIEVIDDVIAGLAAAKEEYLLKDQQHGDQRVTLAELFMADQHVLFNSYKTGQEDVKQTAPSKKRASLAKKGPSKAKKLLPRDKEDGNSLNKLHKFMKRIMKKKVHPEVDRKLHQEDDNGVVGSSKRGLEPHDHAANNESAPLLHVLAVGA